MTIAVGRSTCKNRLRKTGPSKGHGDNGIHGFKASSRTVGLVMAGISTAGVRRACSFCRTTAMCWVEGAE